MLKKSLTKIIETFALKPENVGILQQAFYHSSYINEIKGGQLGSNERLEFLGDGVLNLIIAEHLFKTFPNLPEGELTKKRAQLVREEALVIYAETIELSNYILLGKGEEKTGGRNRPAIIADCFEAFIGAIFLTEGFEKAKTVLLSIVGPVFENELLHNVTDYKSMFQELIQLDPTKKIFYEVILEEGLPHDRTYHVKVFVDDISYGVGVGRTKKEAEQNAAKLAINKMAQ